MDTATVTDMATTMAIITTSGTLVPSPPTPIPSPQGGGERTLARLMIWLSPAFPVGGYSYSHGLEWVVETGGVKNAQSLGMCWCTARDAAT